MSSTSIGGAHFGSMATLFPGCLELLIDLRRASVRLGLITNGGSAMQRSKIEAIEIAPLLDVIVISSESGPQTRPAHLSLWH
jgi:putative hydrolase of the HAD superfamily